MKKQLQDTEEQLHGTLQHFSLVGGVAGQPAESNVVSSTASECSANPHRNSSTAAFIPVRSAVIMSQQDSENKLEITLLEREEGEVIQFIISSVVLEASGSTPLIPSLPWDIILCHFSAIHIPTTNITKF